MTITDNKKMAQTIENKARVNFNKEYNTGMNGLVDMINKRLLGQWEYDLTGVKFQL